MLTQNGGGRLAGVYEGQSRTGAKQPMTGRGETAVIKMPAPKRKVHETDEAGVAAYDTGVFPKRMN